MGGKGKYAIVSCGQTAENLNSLDRGPEGLHGQEVPQAQIVDTVYAGEDQAKADPDGERPDERPPRPDRPGRRVHLSAPGVAQAVRDAGKIGKVFTVGLGTPQSMKPYLNDGSSSAGDPLGRREPRLPDRVGGRPARRRTSRSRPPNNVNDDDPGRHLRRGDQDAAARPAAADHQGQRRTSSTTEPAGRPPAPSCGPARRPEDR